MEQMNRDLVGKVDDLMSFQTQMVDEIMAKVEQNNQNKQTQRFEEMIRKLDKSVDNLQRNTPITTSGDTRWKNKCQEVMLNMAEKLDKIEKIVDTDVPMALLKMAEKMDKVEKTDSPKEEIMIISDSNGKHFDPKRLHHEKKVVMEHEYTLDGATRKIPERENPELVTDIVFMTGLNDSHDHRTSVEEIVNRQKDACHKFHHKFKKAKFHIVAIAPERQKQRNLNKRLSEYAVSAGISYVNNDELIDERTGEVKDGMMKGSHYTPSATSILAKRLKHSLYSYEPPQQQRPMLYPIRQQQQQQQQQQHQQQQFQQRQQIPPAPQSSVNQWNFQPVNQLPNNRLPTANSWQPQSQPLPSAMNVNPAGASELISDMGRFLQKWQTLPERGY